MGHVLPLGLMLLLAAPAFAHPPPDLRIPADGCEGKGPNGEIPTHVKVTGVSRGESQGNAFYVPLGQPVRVPLRGPNQAFSVCLTCVDDEWEAIGPAKCWAHWLADDAGVPWP